MPAKLTIVYKNNVKDKKNRIYEIMLNNLVMLSNPRKITEALYK